MVNYFRCEICKTTEKQNRPWQKFCSLKCKNKYNSDLRKEAIKLYRQVRDLKVSI